MPAQPPRFSNVETALVGYLQGRPELSGVPVAVRLPDGYDGTSAAVVVTRAGGEFSFDDGLDHALLRVDTYGPDKTAALDLAGTVRGLVWAMPDLAEPGTPRVTDVAEQRGPSWLRDPGFATANRYTTRYVLHVRVGTPSS